MTDLLPSTDASTPTPATASTGSEPTRGVQRTRLVVDTSVLIADPHCVKTFGKAALIIPLTVVEELDSLQSAVASEQSRLCRESLTELVGFVVARVYAALERASAFAAGAE